MCFEKKKDKYLHFIAKGPVKCYKIMRIYKDNKVNSLFYPRENGTQPNPYSLGETITSTFSKSFAHTEEFLEFIDKRPYLTLECVHSCISLERLKKRHSNLLEHKDMYVVVECEIPEGEVYWDNDDEYASLSLILKKIL